ncbi:hypothetical protein, partial [Schleiferia thermophila]
GGLLPLRLLARVPKSPPAAAHIRLRPGAFRPPLSERLALVSQNQMNFRNSQILPPIPMQCNNFIKGLFPRSTLQHLQIPPIQLSSPTGL